MSYDEEFSGYADNEFFQDKNAMTDGEEGDESDNIDVDQYRGDLTTSTLNPKSVRERIDENLEILGNLKSRTDLKMSRSQLVETLSKDLSEYYGYLPELSEFLLNLFSPAECVEYMDASDRPRPLVIRTNTLKTTRKDLMEALTKRGCVVEAVEWSKVAIKVTESSVPIGATPEYLGGYYMLQSAASMNPVLALSPQPNERVLDMSAAPGGKTSYIAQLMKNSGLIMANDLKPQRQKATVANLHRLGVKNSIVCCYDGRKITKIMKGFDRVLLDAPCSGLGVISRDPSVKVQRTIKDIQRIAHLQKELLIAAVDAIDHKSSTGGVVVYSTCSISVEENEQVIDYILSKRYVRLIDTGLTVGKPGFTRYQQKRFHSSLNLTRRFYPHVHNMDGFFVAKLQKYENGPRESEDSPELEGDEDDMSGDEEVNFDVGENYDDEYELKKEKPDKKRKKKTVELNVQDEEIPKLVEVDEEGKVVKKGKKGTSKIEVPMSKLEEPEPPTRASKKVNPSEEKELQKQPSSLKDSHSEKLSTITKKSKEPEVIAEPYDEDDEEEADDDDTMDAKIAEMIRAKMTKTSLKKRLSIKEIRKRNLAKRG